MLVFNSTFLVEFENENAFLETAKYFVGNSYFISYKPLIFKVLSHASDSACTYSIQFLLDSQSPENFLDIDFVAFVQSLEQQLNFSLHYFTSVLEKIEIS